MHKILIVNNDLNIGGIQKSLIEFLIHLVSLGHEIDLVLWQKDGVLLDQVPSSVHIIDREYVNNWKNIVEEKFFFKKVQLFLDYLKFSFFAKIIKKPWLFFPKVKKYYNTAIAYSQNGYPLFYTIDNVSADSKYLWYHHGSYDVAPETYKLDKKYYGKFDKLVTVSTANKQMLLEHFPEYRDKFFVVPNIINVEKVILSSTKKVLDFNKKEGVFNFVTVSRFSKEKGIDLAVEIATDLKKQGLKFNWYFIGDGDTFLEIKKIIKQTDIEDVCILLGSKENPYPYMKLADLYIQTSYVESQSITIYDALALKQLIVTTNLPALNDALQQGELGVLCSPEKKIFVEQIKNLLFDRSTRNKLTESIDKHEVNNNKTYKAIEKLF
jgi:glycosyltransferase involved in cell wall biosynthesis|tara:strand:+ start:5053 stop:6195 length:1143 start_codon:yes stop_codon:yes gene_type:complete